MEKFNFDGLFVYDLANNHQGDIEHGLNIIEAMGKISSEKNVRGALKFQFRQLKTFIHADFRDKQDIKHIPRFIETGLNKEQYGVLTEAVRKHKMVSICTPFDEESVPVILELGIDIIKIASCSAVDWPLLERVAEANRPVIVSTAGLNINKIDRLVSFLKYRNVDFALMHCVALYPTPDSKLNLNQIELLCKRYPATTVGFSTHEEPDNYNPIRVAYAKGARIFERHVGMETDVHKLNKYSANAEQVGKWIDAHHQTMTMCGGAERSPADPAEIDSLNSLMRGVFVKKKIKKGKVLQREDVFFAMPLQEKQLTSGEWIEGIKADRDYQANAPISETLASGEVCTEERVFRILLQVKGMLNLARVSIGKESSIEISHHYGIERFREFGAVLIDCINRAYCKKIMVMLPRQKHPYHFHKVKEETFQLLYGDIEVVVDGHKTMLLPGDTLLVKPGEWHKFHTLDGAIFEEVSTTHFNNDSFYEDERIARLERSQRKTELPNWEAAERNAIEHG